MSERLLAQWTMQFHPGPLLDAGCVEVVSTITWQRCYFIRLFIVEQADTAFDMLVEPISVHGSRKFFQGEGHCSLVIARGGPL